MKTIFKRNTLYCSMLIILFGAMAGCDNVTDQPTGPGERMRTSSRLLAYDSCSALENDLKANLKEEMTISLLSLDSTPIYFMEDGVEADTSAPNAVGTVREEGVDYSGTNNQETGVDEADFVKTDGYSLFVLNGQKLVVLDVPEFGLLSNKAALDIEGQPGNMLLYKDNATGRATRGIIFSSLGSRDLEKDNPLLPFITDNVSDEWYYSVPSLTKITVV
ncbi:MAG: hypothetical protein GY868_18300, partial [Deltaproteobacteria bacterium]|nr:hypothetical protein [Deltaproteobacteria bacterium]